MQMYMHKVGPYTSNEQYRVVTPLIGVITPDTHLHIKPFIGVMGSDRNFPCYSEVSGPI